MAWTAAALAASALATVGSAAINSSRGNNQAIRQEDKSQAAIGQAEANRQQMLMLQALINQRSIAGYQDEAGTSMQYDPATNQWISTLGKLPQQVQTSADQAAVSRNTTDLRQQQFANEQAAIRASRSEGAADAARREFENYHPMSQDQLVGLLQQQATNASNETFRPMVQDLLTQSIRSGSNAGPALAQIGKSAAGNLRDSLIDAQLKGMGSVDQINAGRRQSLASSAGAANSLATPAFGYTGINPSSYSQTMANLAGQRSQNASIAPAYGAGNLNTASKNIQDAYDTGIKSTANPNFGRNALVSGLTDLGTATGPGGGINKLAGMYQDYQTKQQNNANAPVSDDSALWGSSGQFGPINNQYNFGGY